MQPYPCMWKGCFYVSNPWHLSAQLYCCAKACPLVVVIWPKVKNFSCVLIEGHGSVDILHHMKILLIIVHLACFLAGFDPWDLHMYLKVQAYYALWFQFLSIEGWKKLSHIWCIYLPFLIDPLFFPSFFLSPYIWFIFNNYIFCKFLFAAVYALFAA